MQAGYGDDMEDMKMQIAHCLRQLLQGKVSRDHLIEEFERHEDPDIAEAVELVKSVLQKHDRYSKTIEMEDEEKRKLEAIVNRLEKNG